MFEPEKVKKLNELELSVLDFILKRKEQIEKMTIRELAKETHVSTSTIVRFCGKLGFVGYGELKYFLKEQKRQEVSSDSYYENLLELDFFLRRIESSEYKERFDQAARMIAQSEYTVFIGIGTSGSLAAYGARYFANFGISAYDITDPFYPIGLNGFENACTIILSVSGETAQVAEQFLALKERKIKAISITNDEKSTIAKMADINFSYYMTENQLENAIQLTSQLPVVALIEILGHRVHGLLS